MHFYSPIGLSRANDTTTQMSEVCAVCMEPCDEGVHALAQTPCAHRFHAACLYRWTTTQRPRPPSCPLCRTALHAAESESEAMLHAPGGGAESRLYTLREWEALATNLRDAVESVQHVSTRTPDPADALSLSRNFVRIAINDA